MGGGGNNIPLSDNIYHNMHDTLSNGRKAISTGLAKNTRQGPSIDHFGAYIRTYSQVISGKLSFTKTDETKSPQLPNLMLDAFWSCRNPKIDQGRVKIWFLGQKRNQLVVKS